MSTALIIFSVFITGAIISNKDTNASNTLFLFSLIAGLTAVVMWAAERFQF